MQGSCTSAFMKLVLVIYLRDTTKTYSVSFWLKIVKNYSSQTFNLNPVYLIKVKRRQHPFSCCFNSRFVRRC